MKWKSLLMPKGIKIEISDDNPNMGTVTVEPLERGWGMTVGNSLRRVLLSSLQGAAVTAVKIDGVPHEYSTVEGVAEDVTDIILNIKQLRVKLLSDEPVTLVLDAKGEGELKASDIEENPNVEIINKDFVIATINSDASLRIEMSVSDGWGYVPAEQNKSEDDSVGTIAIDSMFSPIVKVNYNVENTRVGQRTELDKLIMNVETDGSISVEDSIAYASKLIYDHMNMFINFDGDLVPVEEEATDNGNDKLKQLMLTRIDELELSVRSNNCLRYANIATVGELVRNQESDMLKYKNFGRKSLIELNQVLGNMGISFGMDVDGILGNE